jgi:four helix bundle protein
MKESGFILPHGGYQGLLSYRKAEIVYDLTYRFCQRFFDRGDRTIDQMIQAARSGKQNIAEGSKASGTSKEMEIKLTNVARASLEELLIDYRDFLRSGIILSGKRIPRKPAMYASWGIKLMRPTRPIENFAIPARRKSSPIWPSA